MGSGPWAVSAGAVLGDAVLGEPGCGPGWILQSTSSAEHGCGSASTLSAWVMGLLSRNVLKPFLTLIWHHHHTSPLPGTQLRGAVSPAARLPRQTPSLPQTNWFSSSVVQKCTGELQSSALLHQHQAQTASDARPCPVCWDEPMLSSAQFQDPELP